MSEIVNIVVAGLGGQGVLKASDIIAEVAFRAGLDVKKSEVHGMSQRGGSVASDVRFGTRVASPMVPPGEADFLVALDATQVEINRAALKSGGVLIDPSSIDLNKLASKKSVNVALLGVLSRHLRFTAEEWMAAVQAHLAPHLHADNATAFETGRTA